MKTAIGFGMTGNEERLPRLAFHAASASGETPRASR